MLGVNQKSLWHKLRGIVSIEAGKENFKTYGKLMSDLKRLFLNEKLLLSFSHANLVKVKILEGRIWHILKRERNICEYREMLFSWLFVHKY